MAPSKSSQLVGTGNDHVTRNNACVKTLKHSKLHIPWFSDGKLIIILGLYFAPFALILLNNAQYQLGR